jgi:glycosyltransferase involved in cell wall biosynthesis
MMVGVPSIATFTGGIPSIMRPNVEGRLVQMCDPHVLAGEIRKFFRDHKYAESCVGAAMKRANERHDDENNAKILYETYEQVLKSERE